MKRFFCLLTIIVSSLTILAQKNTVTEEYILRFRDVAIENENEYKIPASITLAQGIIESGSGRSSLAKESNNHFGIKCHKNWTGRKTYKDDDDKNDCFRVYDTPEESYKDHSLFLVNGKRYKDLFLLDKTDYKGWAKGLKKAGYATNPQYADLLINVIEVYELDKVNNSDYYLLKDVVYEDNYAENTIDNSTKNTSDKPQQKNKKHKSLIERLFGNTKWYKRKHETVEQRKRREMDEKIQKMIDEKDVKRNDFEINFE